MRNWTSASRGRLCRMAKKREKVNQRLVRGEEMRNRASVSSGRLCRMAKKREKVNQRLVRGEEMRNWMSVSSGQGLLGNLDLTRSDQYNVNKVNLAAIWEETSCLKKK
ncbi:hypothetical protein [Emergencia timonensis]